MPSLPDLLLWAVLALFAAGFAGAFTGNLRRWHTLTVAANTVLLAYEVLERAWLGAAVTVLLIVILLGGNWWNRKGKKAAKALGAKSRALVADLVARLREAWTPVPDGAGA